METHRPRHGDTGAVVEKEATGLCGDTTYYWNHMRHVKWGPRASFKLIHNLFILRLCLKKTLNSAVER